MSNTGEAFNPRDHLMKLRGNEYLPVAQRISWFHDAQQRARAQDDDVQPYRIEIIHFQVDNERGWAMYHVRITDVNGNSAEAVGSESRADFGDFIEKANTNAVGRALALLGFSTGEALDFSEGDRVVDAPINRDPTVPAAAPAAPRIAPAAVQGEPHIGMLYRILSEAGFKTADARNKWLKTNAPKLDVTHIDKIILAAAIEKARTIPVEASGK